MRSRYLLASAVLALALAGPASARGTLDSILPEIRAQHPGRLSDAEPWTDSEGRTHYRIKWMTPEGRILYFNADADSGRFTNSGGDGGGHRDRQWNGGRDDDEDGGGGGRTHWNNDGDGDGGGGDWRRRHHDSGQGEWHDREQGDWHDRHGDGGGWRGGGNGGDNGGGGRHHRGNGN